MKLRPWWARGRHRIALPTERVPQLREQLEALTATAVWVHLEKTEITVQPSDDS